MSKNAILARIDEIENLYLADLAVISEQINEIIIAPPVTPGATEKPPKEGDILVAFHPPRGEVCRGLLEKTWFAGATEIGRIRIAAGSMYGNSVVADVPMSLVTRNLTTGVRYKEWFVQGGDFDFDPAKNIMLQTDGVSVSERSGKTGDYVLTKTEHGYVDVGVIEQGRGILNRNIKARSVDTGEPIDSTEAEVVRVLKNNSSHRQ